MTAAAEHAPMPRMPRIPQTTQMLQTRQLGQLLWLLQLLRPARACMRCWWAGRPRARRLTWAPCLGPQRASHGFGSACGDSCRALAAGPLAASSSPPARWANILPSNARRACGLTPKRGCTTQPDPPRRRPLGPGPDAAARHMGARACRHQRTLSLCCPSAHLTASPVHAGPSPGAAIAGLQISIALPARRMSNTSCVAPRRTGLAPLAACLQRCAGLAGRLHGQQPPCRVHGEAIRSAAARRRFVSR